MFLLPLADCRYIMSFTDIEVFNSSIWQSRDTCVEVPKRRGVAFRTKEFSAEGLLKGRRQLILRSMDPASRCRIKEGPRIRGLLRHTKRWPKDQAEAI